jgi:hypothetical protein
MSSPARPSCRPCGGDSGYRPCSQGVSGSARPPYRPCEAQSPCRPCSPGMSSPARPPYRCPFWYGEG